MRRLLSLVLACTVIARAQDYDLVIRRASLIDGTGAPAVTGDLAIRGDRIVALTTSHKIPAVFAIRRFAYRGGLMSYGPDPVETVRRAAAYVGRILRGENPATLPVQAPTKFDFIVNLKTARSMGVDIASALLAQADEIVE